MSNEQNEQTTSTPTKTKRLSRYVIYDFVCFCFRDDIANKLNEYYGPPERLAIELYEKEKSVKIPYMTARGQRNKWVCVNGKVMKK